MIFLIFFDKNNFIYSLKNYLSKTETYFLKVVPVANTPKLKTFANKVPKFQVSSGCQRQ